MHSGRWLPGAALGLGLALAGCGDDNMPRHDVGDGADSSAEADAEADAEAEAEADAEADAEAEAEAEADGGGGTLHFIVQDGDTAVPLGEVQVLVQTTAGGDLWLVTDALGQVAIDGLDLAADPPTVSFYRDGYAFVTYVKVDRELSDPVALPPTAAAQEIRVSGTVTGLAGTERGAVGIWSGAGYFRKTWSGTGGAYATRIQAGPTFEQIDGQVFAADSATGTLANWVRADTPYSCAVVPCPAATLDFTLPSPATPMSRASVTLAYPIGSDAFPATPWVPPTDSAYLLFELLAATETDGALLGVAEATRASAAPVGLSLDAGWVTDLGGFGTADVMSRYGVQPSAEPYVYAEMSRPGPPTDGEVIDVYAPAVFSTPPDLATLFSLVDDTAAWTNPDWSTYTILWLYSSDLRTLHWLAILPGSETTFHFPEIPETLSAPPMPTRLGIRNQGYLDAPASVWELFNLGTAFTGTYLGYVYDLRHRVRI